MLVAVMWRSFAIVILPALAWAQATVIVSSQAGDRMRALPPVPMQTGAPSGDVIRIDPAQRFQTIDGFGATFTEAGLMVLNRLPKDKQEETLRRIFNQGGGAGFTLMKSPAAAFDFAADGGWYTYDDAPGDLNLKHFSIARDLKPNGLITYIKRARRHGDFRIHSTTDYPPDWMLDANMSLKPEHYERFARYLVRYLQEYEKQGVNIDYLAPFNEPEFIYCKIKYADIADLIKHHLGPEMRRAGVTTKLQVCESHNRRVGLENLTKILDDPGARQYIGTITVHGYDWEHQTSQPLKRLHERYPDLPIWQSEVCYAKVIDNRPMPVRGFGDGDRWGRMIVSDLAAGASGWIYWNLILDEKGGPWLISEEHGDPKDNPQHPLVIVDGAKGEVEYTGAFWYLAHFSKFVRPGAVRIASSGELPGVSHVAFSAPGGSTVLEIVNSGQARRIAVRIAGSYAHVTLPARSMVTVRLN